MYSVVIYQLISIIQMLHTLMSDIGTIILNCKEIQPVHPKGDQSWVFIGRTDVEAETPILWPPDAKSWLIWKDPDAGKDWGQEEKGTTEDEMVGWHHRLDGYGFGWTLGAGDGQGGLVCCGSWDCKGSDTTEWLNKRNNSHKKVQSVFREEFDMGSSKNFQYRSIICGHCLVLYAVYLLKSPCWVQDVH